VSKCDKNVNTNPVLYINPFPSDTTQLFHLFNVSLIRTVSNELLAVLVDKYQN